MSEPYLTTYTPATVERGYNNRAAVPEHPQLLARIAQLSVAARAALECKVDLRYGPGLKETLDLFLPKGKVRGTLVFIHGGYWRALDKSDVSLVATPFVAAGIAVATINYDLCPDVSVATIVDECRRAVAWIAREGARYGADPSTLVVGGHSAGGHLAAMLAASDSTAMGLASRGLAGALSLSGVHDLAPLVLFSFNSDLRLDPAEARRISPAFVTPRASTPLLLAVGADETAEFLRQTWVLWDRWPGNRPQGSSSPLIVAGCNHFTVLTELAEPASDLFREAIRLF